MSRTHHLSLALSRSVTFLKESCANGYKFSSLHTVPGAQCLLQRLEILGFGHDSSHIISPGSLVDDTELAFRALGDVNHHFQNVLPAPGP